MLVLNLIRAYWPLAIIEFFVFALNLDNGSLSSAVGACLITLVIWIIADIARRLAMPKVYFATGFSDLLGKRFFWAYGPQLTALFLVFLLVIENQSAESVVSQPESAIESPMAESRTTKAEITTEEGIAAEDTDCGRPYPCRLSTIIEYSDWQSVLSALAFGMQQDIKTQIKWSSNQNENSGYVQQEEGSEAEESQCRLFKIVSYIGSRSANEKVTVCRHETGILEIK